MTKKIVGIQYKPEFGAPKVTVKVIGHTAEKIVDDRKKAGDLRLVENAELLDSLFSIPLDSCIDESLFEVVAILLVHIYAMDADLEKNNINRVSI
jgi:type III secretion system FlhB-like substrate exporter